MPDHPGAPEPELLTITEAAEILRTPVATLRFWRHRNIGPRSFRLGRRVLYRRDDPHAWITAQYHRHLGSKSDPAVRLRTGSRGRQRASGSDS